MKNFNGWALIRMSLVNWSGFICNDIDFSSDSILIQAPNGTGKTAIFDAFSNCISGGKSKDIDLKAKSKRGRTALGYILGTHQNGTSRETAVGYIGLTFRNAASNKNISIVTRMAGRKGDESLDELNSMILIHKDKIGDPNTGISTLDFVHDGYPLSWDMFRDNVRESYNIKSYSANNYTDFRREFLSQVKPVGRQLSFSSISKLLTLMKEGFKDNFNENAFIRQYVVNYETVDLSDKKAQINGMRQSIKDGQAGQSFYKSLIGIKAYAEKENECYLNYDKLCNDEKHTKNVKIANNVLEAFDKNKNCLIRKNALDEKSKEILKDGELLLEEETKLKNTDEANLLSKSESSINDINERLQYLANDFKDVKNDIEQYTFILDVFGLDYKSVQEDELNRLKKKLDRDLLETHNKRNDFENKISEINATISELVNGNSAPYYVKQDVDRITEECRNEGINVAPLYSLIDSVDSDYALAVETVLGNMRFALIPETESDYYATKGRVHHKDIVVVKPQNNYRAKENSIAESVHTRHPVARCFLNHRLGNTFVMGEKDQDNITTIELTPTKGFIKHFLGYYCRSLTVIDKNQFVFGKRTKEEQLELIEESKQKKKLIEENFKDFTEKHKNDEVYVQKVGSVKLGKRPKLESLDDKIKSLEMKRDDIQSVIDGIKSSDFSEKLKSVQERKQKNKKMRLETQLASEENIREIGASENAIKTGSNQFFNSDNNDVLDKDVLIDIGYFHEDKDILKKKKIDYMKSYYDTYKDIYVTERDVKAARNAFDDNRIEKQRGIRELSKKVNDEYNEFADIQALIHKVEQAGFVNDKNVFLLKVVKEIFEQDRFKNYDESKDFEEGMKAIEKNINENIRDNIIGNSCNIIKEIERSIRNINGSLKGIEFHGVEYKFKAMPIGGRDKWIKFIKKSSDTDLELFDNLTEEEHKIIKEIADDVLGGEEAETILDPIDWYDFRLSVFRKTEDGRVEEVPMETWQKTGSGGMRKVPEYIALLGAIKNISGSSSDKKSSGLITMFIDEAMENIDTTNSSRVVDLFRDAGIQVIYLTNSSNFPKGTVSKIINMHPNANGDHSVIVDEPSLMMSDYGKADFKNSLELSSHQYDLLKQEEQEQESI